MTKDQLLKAVGAALNGDDPWAGLRRLLLDALASGVGRGTLAGWLHEGREMFPTDEDALLDAMDQLEDWPPPRGQRVE
jgi:hypothetical protein